MTVNNMDYKKIYNNLIISRKLLIRKKNQGEYYEAHHIKPVCFGGDGDRRNINHSNIILLTPKEHYIAHLLLVAIYPNSPCLIKALWNMCQTGKKERYKPSAKIYNNIRNNYIKSIKGNGNHFYGKKHTVESLIKISSASKNRKHNIGKKHSLLTKQKISNARKGNIVLTNETKEKISNSVSGGKHYNAKSIICLNSGKIFGSGKELSEFLNVPFSTIRRWLNGTTNPPKHFHYKRITS